MRKNNRKRTWFEAGLGLAQSGYDAYRKLDTVRKTFQGKGGRAKTARKKSLKYLQGVTTQHDHSSVYKKGYMNKYKKRKWKGFVKKVRAVEIADRGLTTALYNNLFVYTAPAASSQCIGEVHLYGFKSDTPSSFAGVNDLAALIANDYRVTMSTNLETAGTSKVEALSSSHTIDKVFFESAILDCTVTNPNTTTIELDVYRIMYKKQLKGNFTSLTNLYDTASSVAYTNQIQKADTSSLLPLTLTSRGATPFELGAGSSMGNLKILKKEKYLITAGQCITLQIRDSKNRCFNPNDFYASNNSYRYQDWTQSMLFIAKKVAEDTSPCAINIGCTRIYKYNLEGQKNNYGYKLTI